MAGPYRYRAPSKSSARSTVYLTHGALPCTKLPFIGPGRWVSIRFMWHIDRGSLKHAARRAYYGLWAATQGFLQVLGGAESKRQGMSGTQVAFTALRATCQLWFLLVRQRDYSDTSVSM